MKWSLYRWIWRLESPLYIGMAPSGSLNRCRPYVPAQTMFGALTAETARRKKNEKDASKKNDDLPDYGKLGWEISINCRFTYFYPAVESGNQYAAWLPKYIEKKGLMWRREDAVNADDGKSDREFRQCLLTTRPGTAITPETDAAADGTLHETECISQYWRNSDKRFTDNPPVYLVGYAFLKNNSFKKIFKSINHLFIGGDTRYGLGKISKVSFSENTKVFGCDVNLEGDRSDEKSPVIDRCITLNHVVDIDRSVDTVPICGMKEIVGGWGDKKKENHFGKPAWTPGSVFENQKWKINRDWCWTPTE